MDATRRIERVLSIKDIKPNPSNVRVHSNRQIGQIADSIKAFGFGAPVLVDETLTLIAGHGRLRAAELLGLKEVPAIELRGLTPRELEVLAAMADGAANKAIARRLGISFHTAKFHVAGILAKLNADSRTEAVARAAQLGLVML
jgi:DNA-binding NarL/FixJ family response regulator